MTEWKLARYGGGRFVHARIHADDTFVGHVTVERDEYNDLAERLTRNYAAELEVLRAQLDRLAVAVGWDLWEPDGPSPVDEAIRRLATIRDTQTDGWDQP